MRKIMHTITEVKYLPNETLTFKLSNNALIHQTECGDWFDYSTGYYDIIVDQNDNILGFVEAYDCELILE